MGPPFPPRPYRRPPSGTPPRNFPVATALSPFSLAPPFRPAPEKIAPASATRLDRPARWACGPHDRPLWAGPFLLLLADPPSHPLRPLTVTWLFRQEPTVSSLCVSRPPLLPVRLQLLGYRPPHPPTVPRIRPGDLFLSRESCRPPAQAGRGTWV